VASQNKKNEALAVKQLEVGSKRRFA